MLNGKCPSAYTTTKPIALLEVDKVKFCARLKNHGAFYVAFRTKLNNRFRMSRNEFKCFKNSLLLLISSSNS